MPDAGYQLDHEAFRQKHPLASDTLPGPRVVAVGIRSAMNIGTIFRIADAAAARSIIFIDSPLINSQRIRKSARSTQKHIPHRYLELAEFLVIAEDLEPLIALEITSTSADIYQTDLPQDFSIVVGDEKHGIPHEILTVCQRAIHIPMLGNNSSMNVATALGIALYEWHRRWRVKA